MGTMARKALDNYILNSRNFLMKDQDHESPDSHCSSIGRGAVSQAGFLEGPKAVREKGGIGKQNHTSYFYALLRRTYGAEWGRPQILQELMGHEDIMATQIYLSVTNRIKDVYDKTHPRA